VHKDPMAFSLLTYAWVLGIAIMGGVIQHFKEHHGKAFSILQFVVDITTSAFVGILTFWLCTAAEMDELVTAALVGMSGHMGSRSLFLIQNYLKKKTGL